MARRLCSGRKQWGRCGEGDLRPCRRVAAMARRFACAGKHLLTFYHAAVLYIGNLYMVQIDPKVKRGSSELIILTLLARRDMHGYEIGKQVEELSGGALRFEMASLYPVLYRMLSKGCLEAYWETSSAGRKRRYYRLTRKGRGQLAPLRKNWQQFFGALDRIARLQNA